MTSAELAHRTQHILFSLSKKTTLASLSLLSSSFFAISFVRRWPNSQITQLFFFFFSLGGRRWSESFDFCHGRGGRRLVTQQAENEAGTVLAFFFLQIVKKKCRDEGIRSAGQGSLYGTFWRAYCVPL
jgi:hypothetical protein